MLMEKKIRSRILACLLLLAFLFGGPAQAQEKKEDTLKLLNEIAGDFEFEYQGQYMIFVFTVVDGKLMVGPEGETPTITEPIADKEMAFFAFDPDGDEYNFQFARDEDGNLSICTVTIPATGIEVAGKRIRA